MLTHFGVLSYKKYGSAKTVTGNTTTLTRFQVLTYKNMEVKIEK